MALPRLQDSRSGSAHDGYGGTGAQPKSAKGFPCRDCPSTTLSFDHHRRPVGYTPDLEYGVQFK